MSALLLAACGGGGGEPGTSPETPAALDLSQQGDIEFWRGKDFTGQIPKLVEKFNAQHPNGQVTMVELPDSADLQRTQIIQNHETKNAKVGVVQVDVVWTAEFAANGWIEELPADQFPTGEMLPAAVASATYFDKLYAYPIASNGGLLFYRKDLLDKYDLQPPTTFDELKAACDTIRDGEGGDDDLGCYAGQFQKYEGLTVNFDEAVHGAGGVIVGQDGKPNVATPEAVTGLQALVDMFEDGYIPEAAITWQEEQGRQAFQDGELIFHRNWPYVYQLANATDGSSQIAGDFDVAPLPGVSGPGVSSLGGGNYAIAKNAANKGTAADFIKFMAEEEQQKANALAASEPPAIASLYNDPDIVEKYPYFPTLKQSIETAQPRPQAVRYGDVTLAIQDATYGALQGQTEPQAALESLQTKLTSLTE
ncbi:ABC transporter substrate-binding protein [Auraticoccus monumenti]|uniref:ABC transporter substrate-binding protein n=1 Tax=Auraticoccus monumenti TaxID=675864 RepID=UPI001E4510EA|nr:ABC transporter substrate-binding protein [Auraticoccus monumenti]